MLAGDALLAEAFRLACSYPTPSVARELAEATLGMIGGQYLDTMEPGADLETRAPAEDGMPLLRLGRAARSGPPGLPEAEQAPWRAFGDELGLLFQIVDDILDDDGYVVAYGREPRARARRRARPDGRRPSSTISARTPRSSRRSSPGSPCERRSFRPRAARDSLVA